MMWALLGDEFLIVEDVQEFDGCLNGLQRHIVKRIDFLWIFLLLSLDLVDIFHSLDDLLFQDSNITLIDLLKLLVL